MTTNEYPRLCGGTFFTLVLQALRQRMKAREHYSGDSDGLSDPEVLVGLIKVINPDYTDPGKENLKVTANNYKACKISNSTYLPFADHLDAKCAEIDDTIAQKQEQLSTLEAYKKSLIYEYVTGKKEVSCGE